MVAFMRKADIGYRHQAERSDITLKQMADSKTDPPYNTVHRVSGRVTQHHNNVGTARGSDLQTYETTKSLLSIHTHLNKPRYLCPPTMLLWPVRRT